MSLTGSQSSQRSGVILNPDLPQSGRFRRWIFTLNNPSIDEEKGLDLIISGVSKYIFGWEGEAEGKTKHIQGYIAFKNQRTFSAVKKLLPRAHWQKARGTENDNFKYCSKEGKFITNIEPKRTRKDIIDLVRDTYTDVSWRTWQQEVLTMIDGPTDPRQITWIYEKTGNVGKTFLAKFFAMREGTIVCQGKGTDIFNAVNTMLESGTCPKLILVDIPRVSLDYVSYNALECLKNGLLYSGKYEGGLCIFPIPQVLCFANEKPNFVKMSLDRWDVYKIKDDELFKQLV